MDPQGVPAFAPSVLDPRVSSLLSEYPEGLFTQQLHASIELVHRYTLELAASVLQRMDLAPELSRWRSGEGLCAEMAFDPRFCPALLWLLDQAAALGYLESDRGKGAPRYRVRCLSWTPDLAELRATALGIDPGNAPTLDLLEHAAAIYPAVARGEVKADQALFEPDTIPLWLAYFDNANPTYAVNNWVAAIPAVERVAGIRDIRILEIGAGAGSATGMLLRLIQDRGLMPRLARYVVTEPSAFFLRRAQRALARSYRGVPLDFASLDIDREWAAQLPSSPEFDLVYGVNVLHVARDLAFSLREARNVLADGGSLVLGECLQSEPRRPIFPELIFQILDSFREVPTEPEFRSAPGFLSPREWSRNLSRAGFDACGVEPDVDQIRALCPNFLAGAVWGRR